MCGGSLSEITTSQIESYLWESANILRGPVDASDFKTYIFPLLFFKRISDVYDEEYLMALKDSGNDQEYAKFPEQHRFQIPGGCHWKDVRETAVDIGQKLQNALREMERVNPETLYGIFGDAQWSNKDRLSDALLKDLVEHFSQFTLSHANIDSDVLGDSYEFLIKKFADATNKKAGEFYTPRSIVGLMVLILNPQEGNTIYDPACGTGGMLLEAVNHVRKRDGNVKTLFGKLYGQEKNLTTSAIARINLFLHGIEDFKIHRGDTLRQPAFFKGDQLQTFDCVIANPPFSLKKWGEVEWETDPYGRNFAGTPPKSYGDYAWVQHMIKSMNDRSGRMAVVLPHGGLFRAGAEGKIRKKLIEMDIIDSIIGLGPNLFYGTGLAACIMVLSINKPAAKKGKILVIDGSKVFKTGRAQNFLLDEHIDKLYETYNNYEDVEGLAKVATLDDIHENEYNLNIPRYVEPIIEEEKITVEEALADLKKAMKESQKSEERLLELLKKAGLYQ